MKAPDFRYERPASLGAALALLADDTLDAAPLAGGQSLLPMMNFRLAAPDVLVDLSGIEDLKGISVADGTVTIGAMTRYAELWRWDGLCTHLPLVAKALPHIAHDAIRNRGTLGGSVALADPAAEMPAICVALGARVVLAGPNGLREVKADDFFLGLYETDRAEDELVTAIKLPSAGDGERFGFYELARRHGDYAIAGAAIAATGASVRAALFSVADRPLRLSAVEAALAAGEPGGIADALADVEMTEDPQTTEATRRHLAGVVLKRAWEDLS
jgi:carbon-monoxide dehydrogenase medium subunit